MRMLVYPSSGNSSERKHLFIEVTLNLVVFHLLFYFGRFFTSVASLLLAFLSFNTGKFHTIAGNIIQSEGLLLTGRVPMWLFYTNQGNEFSLAS